MQNKWTHNGFKKCFKIVLKSTKMDPKMAPKSSLSGYKKGSQNGPILINFSYGGLDGHQHLFKMESKTYQKRAQSVFEKKSRMKPNGNQTGGTKVIQNGPTVSNLVTGGSMPMNQNTQNWIRSVHGYPDACCFGKCFLQLRLSTCYALQFYRNVPTSR